MAFSPGYSASGDIILRTRDSVVALKERDIILGMILLLLTSIKEMISLTKD